MLGHLDRKAGHAIDASVPRRDDSHSRPLHGLFNRGLDAFLFAGHACRDTDLACSQVGNRLQIGRIACDDTAGADSLLGTRGTVQAIARAYPDYKEFSRAMATVTPFRLIRF
jgi:hypothetical protein